jgi:hypothetical protein
MRILIVICSLVAFGISYFLARTYGGGPFSLPYYELPLSLAPLATIFVSSLIYSEYMEKTTATKNSVPFPGPTIMHACYLLLTIALCVCLTLTHGWKMHLLILGSIFVLFISWDFLTSCMLQKIYPQTHPYYSESQVLRNEVLAGSKYINIPTLITILISYAYLQYGDVDHLIHIHPHEQLEKLAPVNKYESNMNGYTASPIDMFVTGFVAFHLLLSALAYAVLSYGVWPKLANLVSRASEKGQSWFQSWENPV